MSEIICQYRTLRDDGAPLCQIVADLTDLPLTVCLTNDSACRYCLSCNVAPQAPNKVTASMSVRAAETTNASTREEIRARMSPLLMVPYRTTTLENTPCIFRGSHTREITCKPCQANSLKSVKVPAFKCSQHGECTVNNTGTHPRVQACATCRERVAQADDNQRVP